MSSPPDRTAVGWEFDAVDLRAVARWLNDPTAQAARGVHVTAGPAASRVDVYYDTNDRRFHRAGYVLRVRRAGRRREATLESLDAAARHELTEPLGRDATLLQADGPVGTRARAVVGRKRLLQLFEVRTRRAVLTAEPSEGPHAAIALDEIAIRPADGSPPARLRRVGIELSGPAAPGFEAFVEALRLACALQPAALGTYEAGLLSADLRTPHAERFGSTEVDGAMPIGAVAIAILRHRFTELLAREPGTRLGEDIEELHDMRVASRRLRAALALFSDVLPPDVVEVGGELRWVGGVLGAVRDLDVQLEHLDAQLASSAPEDRAALAPLHALLESRRATARETMLEALDSPRYESFVNRFGRVLRARRRHAGPAAVPTRSAAPELIDDRIRKLRRRADRIAKGSEASEYHRVRLECKRLRYALEFFADVYPAARPAIKRLVALQDVLGRHQDADIAIERLRTLAAGHADALPRATIFAMGELAERDRQEMAALRARFPRARESLTGKPWKALRRELADGQADEG